jgi:hypothetical protein
VRFFQGVRDAQRKKSKIPRAQTVGKYIPASPRIKKNNGA